MDDWGFDGPDIYGIESFHVTYMSHFRVHFIDEESCKLAQSLTGWESWDDKALLVKFLEDMIVTEAKEEVSYYGDWNISADS